MAIITFDISDRRTSGTPRDIEAANLAEGLKLFAAWARAHKRRTMPVLASIGGLPVWSDIFGDFDAGLGISRAQPKWAAAAVSDFLATHPQSCAAWRRGGVTCREKGKRSQRYPGGVAIFERSFDSTSLVAWTSVRAMLHLSELGFVRMDVKTYWHPLETSAHQRLALAGNLIAMAQRDATLRGGA
jgi:hypothetical protein